MENQNVLVSELSATLRRVIIIKDNVTDLVTKQLAKQAEMILGQLVTQIDSALIQMSNSDDNKPIK